LNQRHYQLILSPRGWLDDHIIQEIHLNLKEMNPNIEGLQWPILGRARKFIRISGQFVQILHTGSSHWLCVSSVGVSKGTINLYDRSISQCHSEESGRAGN